MDDDVDLAWEVEAACRAACPSPRESVVQGWLFRTAGGSVRRTNSVNPLKPGGDPSDIIEAAERHYRAAGQPAIFRAPAIARAMDPPLERRGYGSEGETTTLIRRLGDFALLPATGTDVMDRADRAWKAARARLSGTSAAQTVVFEVMLDCLASPSAFVTAEYGGRAAGLAYGVNHAGMLVIEAVVTAPDLRRLGLAHAAVSALLNWGAAGGARHACLQVEANNAPALALYRKLGFATELYRYHYRRQKNAAALGQPR
ncbi:MAG: GNAT family N-acetyltransferase [Alphaproteobacteria bacterium]